MKMPQAIGLVHFIGIGGTIEAVREQSRSRIESPPQQENRMARLSQRFENRGEIGLGVNQERRTAGVGASPARFARPQ